MRLFITTLAAFMAIAAAAQNAVVPLSATTTRQQKPDAITRSATDAEPVMECIYSYTASTPDAKSSTGAGILQIAPSGARFSDYTSFCVDSLLRSPGFTGEQYKALHEKEMHNECFLDATVLQGFPAGKMTTVVPMAPNIYTYTENIHPISWTLSDETDSIAGYLCHKATASYGGRDWTAWYTPGIPVAFGPWKLNGLPGLPLKASSDDGAHAFSIIALRHGSTPFSTTVPQNAVKTSREKFLKLKNDFEKNPMANISPESITSITVMKPMNDSNPVLIINDTPIHIYPNGYIPLELQ